jgi:ribose transport system substrate-binding protein
MSLAVSVLSLTGCSGTHDVDSEASRYIAVICKGSQHEFWKTVEQGAMDAGEELGVHVTFEAPEDESQIDEQIKMVEKAIENKADAIVLAPLDTKKLNEVVDEAEDAGIPVLTLDSDVTTGSRVATIGTDNKSAGAIAARSAYQLMEGKGKIAVISFVKGAQTAIERYEGFMDEIKSTAGNGIDMVGVSYCDGDSDKAKEQTLKYLEKYPDIKCIYGTNEGATVGACEAVKELGRQNAVSVIGFDSSDEEISYLEEGILNGMMVQNPYNMGYLGVRNLNKTLNGEEIENKIDTGVTYVDSSNLEDEDTQWLLYPLREE